MKKIYRISIIAVLVLLASSAAYSSSLSIGLEAGYAYNFISTKSIFENTSQTGYHGFDVAVPVEYRILDWLSLDSGVRYVMKNSHLVTIYNNAAIRDFIKIRSFIELPLTVRLSCGTDKLRIFAGGGGYVGYWLGQIDSGKEYTAMDRAEIVDITRAVDISSGYNRFDAGLIAEGGVSYGFDKGTLYFLMRYQYTLTSLSAYQYDGVNTYLDTLSAGIGFLFNL